MAERFELAFGPRARFTGNSGQRQLMSELRRLLAEHDVAERLSETEQNILRMAARGKSMSGIAGLYGFSSADGAQRAVDRIVVKLGGTPSAAPASVNGTASAGPKPSPGDSSQAPRSPQPSTNGKHPPARERVVAYLRDHSEASYAELRASLGISKQMMVRIGGELRSAQRVSAQPRGRETVLRLSSDMTPVAPSHRVELQPQAATRNVPVDDQLSKFVDVEALDAEIDDVHERIAELEQLRDYEQQLLNLRGALKSVGV